MLNRLGRGDQISLGGGVLLVISLFLNWYTVTGNTNSASGSAFDALAFIDVLLLILGVGVIVVILGIAAGKIDALYAPAVLGAGVLAFLLVLFRMIRKPDIGELAAALGMDYGLAFGIFVALVATIVIVAGQLKKASE